MSKPFPQGSLAHVMLGVCVDVDMASKSSKTKLSYCRKWSSQRTQVLSPANFLSPAPIFLHRVEGVSFGSNREATTITILTVFPVDDKDRKREKVLVENVTIQPGFTD